MNGISLQNMGSFVPPLQPSLFASAAQNLNETTSWTDSAFVLLTLGAGAIGWHVGRHLAHNRGRVSTNEVLISPMDAVRAFYPPIGFAIGGGTVALIGAAIGFLTG